MICDYRPPLPLDQAEILHAQMHPARSECLERRAVIAGCLGTAEDHGSICVEGLEVQPRGHLIEWRPARGNAHFASQHRHAETLSCAALSRFSRCPACSPPQH
jgi:hypothetical protein